MIDRNTFIKNCGIVLGMSFINPIRLILPVKKLGRVEKGAKFPLPLYGTEYSLSLEDKIYGGAVGGGKTWMLKKEIER